MSEIKKYFINGRELDTKAVETTNLELSSKDNYENLVSAIKRLKNIVKFQDENGNVVYDLYDIVMIEMRHPERTKLFFGDNKEVDDE